MPAPSIRQELHTYMDTALAAELPELVLRERRLRVSSLPYCGLRHLWTTYNPTLPAGSEEPLTFGKEYFTSVGTTVHTALQRWTGAAGRIYGNWRCRDQKCRALIEFSVHRLCRSCGSDTEYEEFTVKAFKHLSGHTDGLYRSRSNRWWVIDYKTTSIKVLDQHGIDPVLPYAGNKFQITSYVPMLEKLLGIKVSGWALIYIARDNPFKFRVISAPMYDKAKAARMAKLELFDDQYSVVSASASTKSVTASSVDWLVETKFCKNLDHYGRSMRGYNPCPLEAVCFTKNLRRLVTDSLPIKRR